MIGPASGARGDLVNLVHKLTGTQQPRGWENQLPNDILLNLNWLQKKQVIGNQFAELIGGARAYAGTMTDGLEVYAILRTGKNETLFQRIDGAYRHSAQIRQQRALAAVCLCQACCQVHRLQCAVAGRHRTG